MTTNLINPELLGDEFKNLMKRLSEVEDFLVNPTTVRKYGWGPDKCKEIALKKKIPTSLQLASTQREVTIRFLNFYCYGIVPSTYPVRDVILAMCHVIHKDDSTCSEDLIWPVDYYTNVENGMGFTLTGIKESVTADDDTRGPKISPIDTEGITDLCVTYSVLCKIDASTSSPKDVKPEATVDTLVSKAKGFIKQQASGNRKKFIEECNKVMSTTTISQGLNRSQIELIRIFNYHALVMLRATIKSEAQMVIAFSKQTLKNNLCKLIGGKLAGHMAPACILCLQKVASSINKGNSAVQSTQAKVVTQWADLGSSMSTTTEILKATFLTDTAWNGLGILSMIFEVCVFTNISWKTLMDKTCMTNTVSSWNMIAKFFIVHQKKIGTDKTVPWARVIDEAYFTEFSPSKHLVLASLLVETIICKQSNRGILDSVWATQHQKTVTFYHGQSKWLRDELLGYHASV